MGPGQKALKKGLDVYLLMVIILNSRFLKKSSNALHLQETKTDSIVWV